MESLSFLPLTIPETRWNLDPLLRKPHRKLPTVAYVDSVLVIFRPLSQVIWFTWRNTVVLNFFLLLGLQPLHVTDSWVFIHALDFRARFMQTKRSMWQPKVRWASPLPSSPALPWLEGESFTLVLGEKLCLFTLLGLYPEDNDKVWQTDISCCVFVLCVWRMS